MKIQQFYFLVLSVSFLFFSCTPDPVEGCTDELACNYDADAEEDDGSCQYAATNADCNGDCLEGYTDVEGDCLAQGCTDELACNYDADAEEDDGSCQIPLENPIYIVSYDANVSGLVEEEIISYVYIRNASCESIEIDATQSGAGVHPTIAKAKFCLGDICYDYLDNDADVLLSLNSFDEGYFFEGYLKAQQPGIYTVTYNLFTDTHTTTISVEFTVTL